MIEILEMMGLASPSIEVIEDVSVEDSMHESIDPGTEFAMGELRIKDWDAYNEELAMRKIEDDQNTFIMADARDNINQLEHQREQLPYWEKDEREEIDSQLAIEYERLYQARDAYFNDDINRIWIDGYTTPEGRYVAAHWRSPSGMAADRDQPYEYDSGQQSWIWIGHSSKRNEWMNDHFYRETED